MKKVKATARLSIQIYIDCPHCKYSQDLMDPADTGGHDYNEEGFLLKQAFPDKEPWTEAHKDFECEDVTCSNCGDSFDVYGLDW